MPFRPTEVSRRAAGRRRPDGEERRVVLARRIVPCLDIKDGRVVKGVRFVDLTDAGDPVLLARRYEEEGADELVFLDITATVEGRNATLAVVRAVARELTIPFAVGGGVRTVDDFNDLLRAGCDKVSVNSAAVRDPSLVRAASLRFGAQCVVVAIDARRSAASPSGFEVVVDGGRTPTGRDAVAWAHELEKLGAGELLVTSIDRDGTRDGYDLALTRAIRDACDLPVIASGGAGKIADFVDVFRDADADAALAASLFHYAELAIVDLKDALAQAGIVVRREPVAV
ncbi:MAG: hisF [Candidatus Eremiobacteraeota bacterium]|nr:hisF [Candidatus Eremiobacteraeota bacterium]